MQFRIFSVSDIAPNPTTGRTPSEAGRIKAAVTIAKKADEVGLDHAGLPLSTVLEQLEILGSEIVPALRREFATDRPAHVPDAPIHPTLKAKTANDLTAVGGTR